MTGVAAPAPEERTRAVGRAGTDGERRAPGTVATEEPGSEAPGAEPTAEEVDRALRRLAVLTRRGRRHGLLARSNPPR